MSNRDGGSLPDDQQEWLDVVDDQNRVIGQALRGEVHRQGLMHRSCHIMLRNSAGDVFVQRRSAHKDTNPGLWDTSAAGHVDAGETYEQCAVREIAEELGVQINESELSWQRQMPPAADNGFEHIAVFRVSSDQPLVLQSDEISEGRWVSSQGLDDWTAREPTSFTSVFLEIWAFDRMI